MAIDLTEICQNYKGLWVGLEKEDQQVVVASGETIREVMDKAQKKGYPNPILFKVPTEVIPFIGSPRIIV